MIVVFWRYDSAGERGHVGAAVMGEFCEPKDVDLPGLLDFPGGFYFHVCDPDGACFLFKWLAGVKERKGVLLTFGSFARIASSLGCLDSVFADIMLSIRFFACGIGKWA